MLIPVAMLCWILITRSIFQYKIFSVYGSTNKNPLRPRSTIYPEYVDWPTVFFLYIGLLIPGLGEFLMLSMISSYLGGKSFATKEQERKVREQLRGELRKELFENKDLLLSAIEEVESLRLKKELSA